MTDLPRGDGLLALARDLLLRELLPLLPEERRLEGRMVANAMGIAARELAADPTERSLVMQELARLLGGPGGGAQPPLERRLVEALREGRFDGSAELHALLLRQVRLRLAESNPKALRMDDDERDSAEPS